ncbi:aspartate/glutamate racemase family protein [Streptomyces samsunensis]|uniref:Aspartate/glutamate racemase family protein n=1 Tax=Streptomyces malaysiensis subsp. samsunensis TaxID=459658 RepID=A0A9X2LXK4_STRMQ|nr:aspartate/glutamate racemase family protein [Streptomyces samsunensis]
MGRRPGRAGQNACVFRCHRVRPAADERLGAAAVRPALRWCSAVALGLGRRIGVLGIRDEAPPAVRALLGDRFTASARPHGVHRTIDLLAPEGPPAVLEAATGLVASGADTLLLACTGLNTIGIRPLLEERLGVPVVDPVLAAGLLASYGHGG